MCTTSAFEWLCPAWRLGWQPIRLFPYILHCPLCARLTIDSRNWHFYGETMGSRGWTERKTGIERGGASGDARVETRDSQFDVNRSIVIRVNRLPLFVDGSRRPAEHNSRFVLLYFIPWVVEECNCCNGLRVSTVTYYVQEVAIVACYWRQNLDSPKGWDWYI